jgi:hypothetical protein
LPAKLTVRSVRHNSGFSWVECQRRPMVRGVSAEADGSWGVSRGVRFVECQAKPRSQLREQARLLQVLRYAAESLRDVSLVGADELPKAAMRCARRTASQPRVARQLLQTEHAFQRVKCRVCPQGVGVGLPTMGCAAAPESNASGFPTCRILRIDYRFALDRRQANSHGLRPAAKSPEPATSNQQPATESRKQKAESRKQNAWE